MKNHCDLKCEELPVNTWCFDIIEPPHLNDISPNLFLYPTNAIHGHLIYELLIVKIINDQTRLWIIGLTLLQKAQEKIFTLRDSQLEGDPLKNQWTWDMLHSFTFLSRNATNNAIMWNFGNTASFGRHQQTRWNCSSSRSFVDSWWWRLCNWINSLEWTTNSLWSVIAVSVRLSDVFDIFRILLSLNESLKNWWALLDP